MLDINTEFRKGSLFVRLIGQLNNYSVKDLVYVDDLIKTGGINKVTFNLKDLYEIDNPGLKALERISKMVTNEGGRCMICGLDDPFVKRNVNQSRAMKYMYEISGELSILGG